MIESVERVRPQSALADILKYWAPPIIWMALIFYFSTDAFSGENTGSLLEGVFSFIYPGITQELLDFIHFYIRKAGHFTVYAILALLLFRACRSGARARWHWKWAIGSLLVVVFYALLDEYHQTFTRHRVGSIYDSMIDASGAAAALLSLWLLRRRSEMEAQD
ncbi:MAG TPA: VanZ family protein [Blastocatellia bacterium]|nr:VanZ family protein [Blastocatellia bacterium]